MISQGPDQGSLQFLLLSDGAVPVDALTSKKAMTLHTLAKQKKDDCQDDHKHELSNSERGWLSSCRVLRIQVSCHQSYPSARSGAALGLALNDPSSFPVSLFKLYRSSPRVSFHSDDQDVVRSEPDLTYNHRTGNRRSDKKYRCAAWTCFHFHRVPPRKGNLYHFGHLRVNF